MFAALLMALENLVEKESGVSLKKFSEKKAFVSTNYFGISPNSKDNCFGGLLKKSVEKKGLEKSLPRGGYNKRRLYEAYVQYDKTNSTWLESPLGYTYFDLYLQLIGINREALLERARSLGLSSGEAKEQTDYWEKYLRVQEEGAEIFHYLISYFDFGEQKFEYALAEFEVMKKLNKGESGKVKIDRTESGSTYKGSYQLLGTGSGQDILQLSLSSSRTRRPLIILLNKTAQGPFYDFSFIFGSFLYVDKNRKDTRDGKLLLEKLPRPLKSEEGQAKAKLRQYSSLDKFDKELLKHYFVSARKDGRVGKSVFQRKEDFLSYLQRKIPWWENQASMLELFGQEGFSYFFMYFLSKKDAHNPKKAWVSLARFKAEFRDNGTLRLDGMRFSDSGKSKKKVCYKGYYYSEHARSLFAKVRPADSGRAPHTFYFFLKENREKRTEDGFYFEGTYAGWRLKQNLRYFAGRLILIPVSKEDYDSYPSALFPLGRDAIGSSCPKWSSPLWVEEMKRHPQILPLLSGKKDISEDNELIFLPGIDQLYLNGFLHKDLKRLQGVYYYYRTKTRPAEKHCVKRYIMLIDEFGFVYVRSKKGESNKIYQGSLMLDESSNKVVATLYKEEKYGGTLIFEMPSPGHFDTNPFLQGLHVSPNYHTDMTAGRVYLQRIGEKVDWERMNKEESPIFFEKGFDGKWIKVTGIKEKAKKEEACLGSKLRLYLNDLCGQINNFLIFRNSGYETQGERRYNISRGAFGSYAEDVLRSAALFWKEGKRDRFFEAFMVGILEGGYSDIEQLRSWFVEDPQLEGCEDVLRQYIENMKDKGQYNERHQGAGLEKRKQRLRLLVDTMFPKKSE